MAGRGPDVRALRRPGRPGAPHLLRLLRRHGRQPIRNGDLANLSASLLGLSAVPDSLWDADQTLTWSD